MDRIEPAEPMLPIDSTEPVLPIDSTEPREPIDSTESVDHRDRTEEPLAVTSPSCSYAFARSASHSPTVLITSPS